MDAAPTDDRLFRAVFEGTLDALLLIDDEGTYVEANEAATELFGRSREELIGRSIGEFVPPELDFQSTWETLLEEGEMRGTFELHRPDGETRTVEFTASADIAPGIHLFAIRDLTDHREYQRMLEQQNQRLEEYSATVSHDLRSPLSVASGWLDVAIQDDSTEYLGNVENALDRMEQLITDLRALGRCGQTVEEMVETDLESVVTEAWSNVETADATLDLEDDLGTIEGEHGRLLQLFENLFRNAIEHAGEDVTVRVGPLDRGFYVEDDGPGVPESEREDVFEFGYSTVEGETGIGLAIVDAVADAHGWERDLVDTEPHGVRFEFRTGWHPDRDGSTTPASE